MANLIRQRQHVGKFGSLNDGSALPALADTDLPVARNIEHASDGAVNKRPGRAVHAALAPAAEPFCAPVLTGVTDADGSLLEQQYFIRVTYVTAAGETDDLKNSDPATLGAAEANVTLSGGQNAIQVEVPFHMRAVQRASSETFYQPEDESGTCESGSQGDLHPTEAGCAGGNVPCRATNPTPTVPLEAGEGVTQLTITPTPVAVCSDSVFEGWPVYSRSPRLQDESHLGVNVDAEEPLYHRVKPLATVLEYDGASGTFTLDTPINFGDGECLDDLTLDIMMPDRGGLPVRHFNVYVSTDGTNFYYATSGISGVEPVTVTTFDSTATRAPSTRVTRTAPGVTAVSVSDTLTSGGTTTVSTGIAAGVYRVRYAWVSGSPDLLEDPGHDTAAALLGIPLKQPPYRCRQELWPSAATFVAVNDGEGIQVTVPSLPIGVVSYNVYVMREQPMGTASMTDGLENGYLDTANTNTRPYAFFFPDKDLDPFVDATVLARKADVSTFPPMGSGSGAADESGAGNSAAYEQLGDTTAIDYVAGDPYASTTRGFPPAYQDLTNFTDGGGDDQFIFASSRDASDVNRLDLNFWMGEVTGHATGVWVVLRLGVRARMGRTTAFNPSTTGALKLYEYNYQTAAYTLIEDDFPVDGNFHEYEWTRNITTGLTFDSERFLSYVLVAENEVGFDVSLAELDVVGGYGQDPDVSPYEVLQAAGLTDTTTTLQNPLVERPVLADSDYLTHQGSWTQLWPNTTAQWPVVTYTQPIVGDDGLEDKLVFNFVGCADSVLRDKGDGSLERVYHVEGRWWPSAMRYDWRFTHYQWRTFFCNPGLGSTNLRFDGVQTHAMGLPWPAVTWEETTDDAGNYVPPFTTDIGDELAQEACEERDEQPLTDDVDVAGVGPFADDETIPEGTTCWDVEYYLVYKRILKTPGRSYVVRSAPRRATPTAEVCGSELSAPVVEFTIEIDPEPQVTHVEIYRNQQGTAQYYLVQEIQLDGSVERLCDRSCDVPAKFARFLPLSYDNYFLLNRAITYQDPNPEGFTVYDGIEYLQLLTDCVNSSPDTNPDGRLSLTISDEVPQVDDDLILPAEFETGRPPAAVTMTFHRGRVWFIQQDERELLAFTNITSPSGTVNPEGFDVNHVVDPPMRGSSALTAITPYHDNVLAHSDNGIVGIVTLSGTTNSASALQANALAADSGAVGPDAWCNVDNVQYLMTRKGPAVLAGDELVYIGQSVEGTLENLNWKPSVIYNTRLAHYRARGRSQVWFTCTQDAFGELNACLVFDEEVRGVNDRAQAWKTWTQMQVHGLSMSEDVNGDEFPLLGGCDGRLYRHDRGRTDAGLFIPFEVRTKFFDEAERGRSVQPRWAYWHVSGDHGDVFFVDVRKDYEGANVNTGDIRIPLGGGAGTYWNATGMSWFPDGLKQWGDADVRPYTEQRMSMGQSFRQLQLVLSQTWARLPPGHKREASFECAGYDIFLRMLGPRPAVAGR